MVVCGLEAGEEPLEGPRVGVDAVVQFGDEIAEVGEVDVDGAVATPGRSDIDAVDFLAGALVIVEAVGGVVCGADHLDVHVAEEFLGAHIVLCELFAGLGPYLVGGLGRHRFVDAEAPLQVQMEPLVDGVARHLRDDFSERGPLLAVGGVARYQFLVDASFSHHRPDVVVGRALDRPDVVPAVVLDDLDNVRVGVRVDDRSVLDAVVQVPCRRRFEQIVVVEEAHVPAFPREDRKDTVVAPSPGHRATLDLRGLARISARSPDSLDGAPTRRGCRHVDRTVGRDGHAVLPVAELDHSCDLAGDVPGP